jgi:hypothetical protein
MLRAAASRWKDRKDRAITEMKGEPRAWGNAASALLPVATAAVAAGIFIVDSLTPPDVVVPPPVPGCGFRGKSPANPR